MTKTLKELTWRRNFCKMCISILDEEVPKSDERRAPAMELYKEQLASIDAQITELTGKPPAITVGLKTAVLFGEPQKVNK